MTATPKFAYDMPRYADTLVSERRITVSLPAMMEDTKIAPDRWETLPHEPTIRARKTTVLHGAALAAHEARKVEDLAKLICAARSATLPAVTVAMGDI